MGEWEGGSVACERDPEAELLARCRAGDHEAFRRVVELHHQRIYRVAYAVMAEEGEAAEVTQETFIKAWRGLPRFRGDAALATWLTRLALNTARDHLRRQRARQVLHLLRGTARAGDDDPAEAVAERDAVRHALGQLSPQARQIVALRYGQDHSIAEIAALLACPEGTVKSRLNGALIRLRAILQRERATSG
jgi:RNA polymerase sigma-70 factor, ECF subfamily